jgi:tetratricopeptide (TPR) repeat protein
MKIKFLFIFLGFIFTQSKILLSQSFLSNNELQKRAEYFQKLNQGDSANFYFQTLADRFEQNDLEKYIFWYRSIIINLFNNRKIEEVIAIIQNLSKYRLSPENQFDLDMILGLSYQLKYDDDKALEIYEKHLRNSAIQSSQLANVYIGIADIYIRKSLLHLALEYYQQAERIYLANPNTSKIILANFYKSLADIYLNLHNFKMAEQYYQKIPKILDLEQNPNQNLIYLNGMARLREDQGKYQSAMEYWQLAWQLQKVRFPPNHPTFVGMYRNLSQAYQNLGRLDSAYYYLQVAEGLARQVFASKSANLAYIYQAKARFFTQPAQTDSALVYYQKALLANVKHFDNSDIYQNPSNLACFDTHLLLETLQAKAQILQQKPYTQGKAHQTALQAYQLADKITQQHQKATRQTADQLRLAETANQLYEQALEACWKNR